MEDKKLKRVWDNYTVIGEVRKSDSIKFVVAAATRKGFRYINIREFYFQKKNGEWRPGRDGITIPLKAPLNKGERFIAPFKSLHEMLAVAAKFAEKMDLMIAENAVWAEPYTRKAQSTVGGQNED